MEFLQKLFKDKNFRNLFFAILGFIGIIIFPPLWILFLSVAVISMMFAAVNQDSKEKNSNEERNTNEKGFVDQLSRSFFLKSEIPLLILWL